MRITGGLHRGRPMRTPAGSGTRPTQDRVRQALYSSLALVVWESHVLDLFAGTGAMGLEAWSRGASCVDFVESGPAALRALRANVATLGAEAVSRVIAADVFKVLAGPPRSPHAPYGLVVADPPYAPARERGYMRRLGELLAGNGWLKEGGFFVFETEGHDEVAPMEGYELAADKTYGATRLLIWRFKGVSD